MESFSTQQSISLSKQTASDEVMSPSSFKNSFAKAVKINYESYNPQVKSKFASLLQNKRDMMLISLLQFLDFKQIGKLSLICKKVIRIIDPVGCQIVHNHDQCLDKSQQMRCMHLKYVAAIQILRDGYQLNNQQIDNKFGLQIKQFNDLQYLNGSVFKDQLMKCLQNPPTHIFQKEDLKAHYCHDQLQSQTFISVFDSFTMLQNPLTERIHKMKLDYNSGGFFNLFNQNIVLSSKSFAADYQILIPSIKSEKAYEHLCLHNNKPVEGDIEESMASLKIFDRPYQISSINLEHMNGIGRIVQYQGGLCDSKQVWVIYEGEIYKGKAHGFGRAIYGDSKNNHIGYFENGLKCGLGIEMSRKGRIVQQGVFNDKNLVKKMQVNSFEKNVSMDEIKELEKEYWKDFLPFNGQTSYQIQIREDLNFLDGFEDELDVRDDDEFDMEMQPDSIQDSGSLGLFKQPSSRK